MTKRQIDQLQTYADSMRTSRDSLLAERDALRAALREIVRVNGSSDPTRDGTPAVIARHALQQFGANTYRL